MIKSTSFWLCLVVLFVGVFSQQCSMDYECGNVPYTICDGGVDECSATVPGLGVDAASNQIYFGQICRTENTRVTNVTFKSLTPAGGVPTEIQSRQQQPAAVNPGYVFDVVGDNLYYSIQSRSPGQLLTAINLNTLVESDTISTESFFQNIIEFDQIHQKTYVCNVVFREGGSYYYDVRAFDGILAPGVGPLNNYSLDTIEIPSVCAALRVDGDYLYYAVVTPNADYSAYSSAILRRSATSSSGASEVLFNVSNSRIQDFDVSGNRIYYGTTMGVYSSNLSGGDLKHISWSSGATGVRILGDRVYWNSGVSILSDSLSGNDVKQLNRFEGTCRCRSGFSGASCTTCEGGQIQWFEGRPSCVPFSENGNPTTCNYDYECAGSPYTYCSGSCQCRTGLTGAGCNQCADSTQTLTWVNGFPTCQ